MLTGAVTWSAGEKTVVLFEIEIEIHSNYQNSKKDLHVCSIR